MRHPYFDLPHPIVFGHRGASGERPENTLEAFRLAIEQGALAIETDVHRSADGHVVVAHDALLDRMTNGTGRVDALPLAALQALDAGYRFSADGRSFPFRAAGIRIPTLAELFDAFPDTPINVEIKENDPTLIDATIRLIEDRGRADRTLLAAEKDDTMAALRAALARCGAKTAIGASVGDVLGFVQAAVEGQAPPPEPMALQIPAAFAGKPLVTPELIAFAHRHDTEIHVWTINDEDEMHRLLDLGVDAVMSDYPGRLRRVVDARAAR